MDPGDRWGLGDPVTKKKCDVIVRDLEKVNSFNTISIKAALIPSSEGEQDQVSLDTPAFLSPGASGEQTHLNSFLLQQSNVSTQL